MIKIIYFHDIFRENATYLSTQTGWKLFNGFQDKSWLELHDILIVFGIHECSKIFLQCIQNLPFSIVLIQSENINSAYFTATYRELLQHPQVYVFNYSLYNQELLHTKYNIRSHLFSWNFFSSSPFLKKTFDIAFIGASSRERKTLIQSIQRKRPDLRYYINYQYNLGYEKLTKIYQNTKYVLNISIYRKALETHRILKALSCGANVISTYSIESKDNDKYQEYIYFTDDFLSTIKNIETLPPKKKYSEFVEEYQDEFTSIQYFAEQL